VIYFAPDNTLLARKAMDAHLLGCSRTPAGGSVIDPDVWDVMLDNGCFGGGWEFDPWYRWLGRIKTSAIFAVSPDVFDPSGGECHKATLANWRIYAPMIRELGHTPAFVAQVGSSPAAIPLDATVVFLGGTTAWKIGPVAEAITRDAKKRGCWVHMGRVNTLSRIELARSWGCDSVDGTCLVYSPKGALYDLLRWMGHYPGHPVAEEIVAELDLDPDVYRNWKKFTCPRCGVDFRQPKVGRPRRFCSDTCRKMNHKKVSKLLVAE